MTGFARALRGIERLFPSSGSPVASPTKLLDEVRFTHPLLRPAFEGGARLSLVTLLTAAGPGTQIVRTTEMVAGYLELPVFCYAQPNANFAANTIMEIICETTANFPTTEPWGHWNASAAAQSLIRQIIPTTAVHRGVRVGLLPWIGRGEVFRFDFVSLGAGEIGRVVYASVILPGELVNYADLIRIAPHSVAYNVAV